MRHEDYLALEARVRQDFPDLKIAFKSESRAMKVLGWFAKPIAPDFLTRFTTVLGHTVYYPSPEWLQSDPGRAFSVLAHEYVHLKDFKANAGSRFLYLFPQVLALPLLLLSIGFACVGAALLCVFTSILTMACLMPWTGVFRADFEIRGYLMTLLVSYWTTGQKPSEEDIQWVDDLLQGSSYYWATRRTIRSYLLNGVPPTYEAQPYSTVRELLKSRGLYHSKRGWSL